MARRRRHSLHRWKYTKIRPKFHRRCAAARNDVSERDDGPGKSTWSRATNARVNRRARWNETRVVGMNWTKKKRGRKRSDQREKATPVQRNDRSFWLITPTRYPDTFHWEASYRRRAMLPSTAMFFSVLRARVKFVRRYAAQHKSRLTRRCVEYTLLGEKGTKKE